MEAPRNNVIIRSCVMNVCGVEMSVLFDSYSSPSPLALALSGARILLQLNGTLGRDGSALIPSLQLLQVLGLLISCTSAP